MGTRKEGGETLDKNVWRIFYSFWSALIKISLIGIFNVQASGTNKINVLMITTLINTDLINKSPEQRNMLETLYDLKASVGQKEHHNQESWVVKVASLIPLQRFALDALWWGRNDLQFQRIIQQKNVFAFPMFRLLSI